MKKTWNIIYIVCCLLICVLPFAGMAVYRTDTTTENKTLAGFPKWTVGGRFNTDYFDELSAYFEDHFAFRRELVSVDAKIQNAVFGVSNVDTVVAGTEGWLYYTDTVDDYLGQNVMTKRQVFNAVHNLSLLQQYVTEHGAQFRFTVAPNKNSLYGDNMPYYLQHKAGKVRNIGLLKDELIKADIAYVDLFEPFQRSGKTLYLKRDSHWDNEGAVLAYNTLMDSLEIGHETYETVQVIREEREYGDLNKMVYPMLAQPEWNSYYQYESGWSYTSADSDVEAAWLETECPKGEGSLLMFRDSFGNTLIPLMAEQFSKAAFSKSVPCRIAEYMEQCEPELVIVEKVERNLDEYMRTPPIMPAPEAVLEEIEEGEEQQDLSVTIHLQELMEDTTYWMLSGKIKGQGLDWMLSGKIKEQGLDVDTPIYVRLTAGEQTKCYEAFTVTDKSTDYGYRLFLKKEEMETFGLTDGKTVMVDILIRQGDTIRQVASDTVDSAG